jgi:hypothetical protein
MNHFGRTTLAFILIVMLGGCSSIGAGSISRDRFDYAAAISASWKSQMLMNMVKLRYSEPPVFLEVAAVISQYQVDSLVNLGFTWADPVTSALTNTQSVGGSVRYSDRPTITYNLLSGDRFARSLMMPIPPAAIMSLIEAGWPAELVLRLTVQGINGIFNRSGAALRGREADPRFYQLIEAMGRVQRSGTVGMRVPQAKTKDVVPVLVFSHNANETVEADRRLIRDILGLNAKESQFSLAFGLVPQNDREVAILSRSMLDILVELSGNIEVPEQHVVDKRTFPTREEDVFEGQKIQRMMHIFSEEKKPDDAFAAVHFHNYWFWIDDRDWISKRVFSMIMFLFTLTERAEKEGVPIVTIPAG